MFAREIVRVGILDDHSLTLAGYEAQLKDAQGIQVAWTAQYYNFVKYKLKKFETDVLVLDASVPSSDLDDTVFPIFQAIPELLELYPEMSIIIISMHNRRAFIKNLQQVGISGYIIKDDTKSLNKLGEILRLVGQGGIYFSPKANEALATPVEDKLNLTPRQVEVLSYWASNIDKSAKDIAIHFDIANSTLRNHLSDIYIRLEVNRLAGAIEKAKSLGIITPNIMYQD